MVYITGDTHGRIHFDKIPVFLSEHKDITRDDFLIIAGDFGAVFMEEHIEKNLNMYASLPVTVLFVDGNHENFDKLKEYPRVRLFGGICGKLRDNVYHLLRGEIYDIEGKSFFTFGGGTSVDRAMRTPGFSFWEEEIPSEEELSHGIEGLKKRNYKVDFIITHSADSTSLSVLSSLGLCSGRKLKIYPDNLMLDRFAERVDFGHWYFGHYHVDFEISDNRTALFHKIKRII